MNKEFFEKLLLQAIKNAQTESWTNRDETPLNIEVRHLIEVVNRAYEMGKNDATYTEDMGR